MAAAASADENDGTAAVAGDTAAGRSPLSPYPSSSAAAAPEDTSAAAAPDIGYIPLAAVAVAAVATGGA